MRSLLVASVMLLFLPFVAAGAEWEEVDFPRPMYCAPRLDDITFTTDYTGFAVGTCMTLMQTKDGGATWQRDGTIGDIGSLHAVEFLTPLVGVAVGVNGIFQPLALVTTTGGLVWEPYVFYIQDGSGGHEATLTDVAFVGTAIFATASIWSGEGAIVRSLDLGQTWQTMLWTPGRLYALEASEETMVALGMSGTATRSTDAGATWSLSVAPGDAHIMDVAFAPDGTAWAAGLGGIMLRSADTGATWADDASGLSADLHDVEIEDGGGPVVVGNAGTIVYRATGGWVHEVSPGPVSLRSLVMLEDMSYVGGANVLYRTGCGDPALPGLPC